MQSVSTSEVESTYPQKGDEVMSLEPSEEEDKENLALSKAIIKLKCAVPAWQRWLHEGRPAFPVFINTRYMPVFPINCFIYFWQERNSVCVQTGGSHHFLLRFD